MTAAEFGAALQRLGLTQQRAAALLDVDTRTARRWATDDQPVPRAVAIVLAAMERHGWTADDVDALLPQPKRRRR